MSLLGYNEPHRDWHNYEQLARHAPAGADFLATPGHDVYRRRMQQGHRGKSDTTRASAEGNEPGAPGTRTSESHAEPRWMALLGSIRTLQMELKRREPGRAIGLSGNPSAPESAIVVSELRLGRKLPPSYREFLAFSDGWTSFFNGASLLGTGDIGRIASLDPTHERLLARGRLLPFGADRAGASLFAFDTSVRLADGELGVVAWVGGLGIDCRCFTSFLATVLQLCRAELSTVRAAEPPAAALPAGAARGWLDVG